MSLTPTEPTNYIDGTDFANWLSDYLPFLLGLARRSGPEAPVPRDEWTGYKTQFATMMHLQKSETTPIRPFTYELLWQSVVLVGAQLEMNGWRSGLLSVYDELPDGTEELCASGYIKSV